MIISSKQLQISVEHTNFEPYLIWLTVTAVPGLWQLIIVRKCPLVGSLLIIYMWKTYDCA